MLIFKKNVENSPEMEKNVKIVPNVLSTALPNAYYIGSTRSL